MEQKPRYDSKQKFEQWAESQYALLTGKTDYEIPERYEQFKKYLSKARTPQTIIAGMVYAHNKTREDITKKGVAETFEVSPQGLTNFMNEYIEDQGGLPL